MHILVAALAAALLQTTPAPSPAAPAPGASTAPVRQTAPRQTVTAPNQPSFSDLIASLNNMRSEIAQIRAMNGMSADNLQPVNVAQLSGSNPSALNAAVSRNQAQLNQLRSALSSLTITTDMHQRITVAQFLSDNRMSTSQIVGAQVKNGKLVLYYTKP